LTHNAGCNLGRRVCKIYEEVFALPTVPAVVYVDSSNPALWISSKSIARVGNHWPTSRYWSARHLLPVRPEEINYCPKPNRYFLKRGFV